MIDLPKVLSALQAARVEFIVIGGIAALAHGSPRLTSDLDVLYRRTPENIDRLVRGLSGLNPYLRGAPPGLPFRFDGDTVRRGLNFTLTTTAGDVDVLGEVVGGGTYDSVLPHSAELTALGATFRCVSLRKLIELKRAAGRPKDLEAIAELEALEDELEE